MQRIELNYLSPRFHRRLMQLTAFDIEAGHPPQTVERALRALMRRMLLLSTSGFKPTATPSGKSERTIRLALGDGGIGGRAGG